MEALTVIIVDDEPLARSILESYVNNIPDLHLVASCKNALEAFSVLSRQKVDLLLLDINMPEISGLDLLKTLRNPPAVIFTTAYPEFAAESYDLDAVDYLMKPVSFERFGKAIDKWRLSMTSRPHTEMVTNIAPDILFIKSDSKLVKVELSELLYVEGLKDYMKLGMASGKHIIHGTMKNMEEQLSRHQHFLRVNKSYIVNLRYITEVDGNIIKIRDLSIPIGNTYRNEVLQMLNRFKLM